MPHLRTLHLIATVSIATSEPSKVGNWICFAPAAQVGVGRSTPDLRIMLTLGSTVESPTDGIHGLEELKWY